MEQDIENIIKKNLPQERKLVDRDGGFNDDRNRISDGFNQALSQINTSLIADEVLKVVAEKIEKYIQEEIGKGTWTEYIVC